jgi:hypothetical protein
LQLSPRRFLGVSGKLPSAGRGAVRLERQDDLDTSTDRKAVRMACRFTELVIDCQDHQRVGEFWAAVLGYEIVERNDRPDEYSVKLQGPVGSGPTILAVRVPELKTVKDRLHIDVSPTDRDQDAEVERILGLGATRTDVGRGEQTWVVLADPEGNEFCVLRGRVD